MASKNVTEVVIDGKIYKLGGYESEEYLHQVASYLNSKITEMKGLEGYHRLSAGMKSIMLGLNTADDYFKARKSVERLEGELSDKDRQLYEMKHELVSLQIRQEDSERQLASLRDSVSDYQKHIAALEAQLKSRGQSEVSAAAVSESETEEMAEYIFTDEDTSEVNSDDASVSDENATGESQAAAAAASDGEEGDPSSDDAAKGGGVQPASSGNRSGKQHGAQNASAGNGQDTGSRQKDKGMDYMNRARRNHGKMSDEARKALRM